MLPTRSSSISTIVGLSLFALVSACSSVGSSDDQGMAASLWTEIATHHAWGQFPRHLGVERGKSPHGKFIATFINAATAGSPNSPPHGSIIVKENFNSKDPASLSGFTVMKRIEGYDPENGDWFWARFEPNGELTHAGKVSMCIDCHFSAPGGDAVFLND